MSAKRSIQSRLLRGLFIGLPLVWLLSLGASFWTLYHQVNELHDTQMSRLARRLLTVPNQYTRQPKHLPPLKRLLDEEEMGNVDDDHMTFAIFNPQNQVILADKRGRFLRHLPKREGFYDWNRKKMPHRKARHTRHGDWRVLYLRAPNGISVMVVQSMRERYQMIWHIVLNQMFPWLLALPLIGLLAIFSVRNGLKPLKTLANTVQHRRVDDATPLDEGAPKEVYPLVEALNRLFRRTSETLEREQRFTADAAHELRSPLAALKIQAQVLSLSEHEEDKNRALNHIHQGIDRATRLVDQLLILSKLESTQHNEEKEEIDWETLSEQVLQSVSISARKKHIRLRREVLSGSLKSVFPLRANTLLIEVLLRNLLDNAIRYSPTESTVCLQMSQNHIAVIDQGQGIEASQLERVRDRFYRPAGQTQSGSGLGLSIVEQIAWRYDVHFMLYANPQGGLVAQIAQDEKHHVQTPSTAKP